MTTQTSSPVTDTAIPLADHDEIGRKVLTQPWAIQSAIVTITAHCRVLVDEHPTGKVADLAGCISQGCLELADALAGVSPDPQIAAESERAEGWKRLAYATADECVARHAPAQQPASPVTDTLLARLERCAKYDFDTIEMIECKWELWDEILEALTRPAQSQQQPVAWRWRPRGATLWIYNPEAQWLAEHRDEADIEVEPLYAAPVQRQPTPSEAELVKVKTVRLYEYTRARNLMIEILRDRAWTITDRDLKAFDEAFQHAIGLLAITTSTVTSTSSCTPLSAPGDAQ